MCLTPHFYLLTCFIPLTHLNKSSNFPGDITRPPMCLQVEALKVFSGVLACAICSVTVGSRLPRTSSRKWITWPLERPPHQFQKVKKGDQRCTQIWPCGPEYHTPTGNAQWRRQENELQCGFLFRRTGDLGWVGNIGPSCAPLPRWRSRKSHRR